MQTIGDVAKQFGLPISTLRYYDKEGLFPEIERVAGIRKFSEKEIEALRVIDCLKKSGLEIKDIKQFMDWTKGGNETFQVRKELFEQQAMIVQEEIEKLEKVQEMIKFKMWYYEEALKKGDEALVQTQIPDGLPDAIKQCYDNSHQ